MPSGRGAFCLATGSTNSHHVSKLQTNVPPNHLQVPNMQQKVNGNPLAAVKNSSTDINGDELDSKNKLSSMEAMPINGEVNGLVSHDNESDHPTKWPCGDDLDKRMIKFALPCIANFAIAPLIGAVDLFWVNRMRNPLAVAGQAASNQIFNSLFWLSSFLPSVTATLVAKKNAEKDLEGTQVAICDALFVGVIFAMIGSALILSKPEMVLSAVLNEGAPAMEYAKPYLLVRGFGFLPSIISVIGFSAFRGTMDSVTPLKISLFANLFNAIFDPLLIFSAKMGVTGAALATLTAEVISAITFTTILFRKNLINLSKLKTLPKIKQLAPLLKGGAALQLRNFALNLTFIMVTRVTQSIDNTGVAASAHAMAIQTFQIGGIVLLALSTVAQTIVPSEMIEKKNENGKKIGGVFAGKAAADRLMRWGFLLGIVLGALQLGVLPLLQKANPLPEVRQAALIPSYLACLYQVINGLVFIGEGIMVATGNFLFLSMSTIVATFFTNLALKSFPQTYGLAGVWMSFGVFNTLRLLGVWLHQKQIAPWCKRIQEKQKLKES